MITCPATLYLADDHGDNSVTFHCKMAPGHTGQHEDLFQHITGQVTVRWWRDQREVDLTPTDEP